MRVPNRPIFALIVYAFGMVAVTSAAVASGPVAPAIAFGLREAQGAQRDVWMVCVAALLYRGAFTMPESVK